MVVFDFDVDHMDWSTELRTPVQQVDAHRVEAAFLAGENDIKHLTLVLPALRVFFDVTVTVEHIQHSVRSVQPGVSSAQFVVHAVVGDAELVHGRFVDAGPGQADARTSAERADMETVLLQDFVGLHATVII